MRNKLIKKCKYGTPRGGLVPHQESGSWGDRGQGNELQSALENGLTGMWNGVKWVGWIKHINEKKQGGRLIPKHAKGSPVNTNPLPEMPVNTNPIPKKEDKKKNKLFKID
jgi:hypothetical protein